MDALITEAFMLHPLSDEVNERFTQCLMSFQPRMESFIEQLKNLIANPPTESTYPKIDDREIFPHEEEEEEGHDEDIENNHTSDTNHDPATENSDL
ncbi:hypothetical protein TRFO_15812 [Tritrichomonas foetus]|uniref:Uncharacterized protein n=1 Tax=Tritrichomonas foetus TaxID=1144522 RepID=A0A1J4KW45_9EUKA|nr:hypothetical protein TRFO_15812 [Tritrichomonas foetus]|eukprot:OHT13918.1 hypothetical protein TRFO_15812 [Tritrichomonas foetus]